MQANCPHCAHKITVDDAKIPERAFSVKCPKCGGLAKFPGKAPGATAAPAGVSPPSPPAGATESAPPPAPVTLSEAGPSGRALVSLPDRTLIGALAPCLGRLGFSMDTVDDPAAAARLLDQAGPNLVITTRSAAASGGPDTLYQRIGRTSPDVRRHFFLVLVGDEFRTGDSTQAFAVAADLVVHSKDAATCESALKATLSERSRLYQAFLDAKHRHEASV